MPSLIVDNIQAIGTRGFRIWDVWLFCWSKGISFLRAKFSLLLSFGVITLQLGAFSVVLETLASGITSLPFSLFLVAMQPIHLAIGFVDGLITAAVLCFIYEMRTNILWGVEYGASNHQKFAFSKLFALLSIILLLLLLLDCSHS